MAWPRKTTELVPARRASAWLALTVAAIGCDGAAAVQPSSTATAIAANPVTAPASSLPSPVASATAAADPCADAPAGMVCVPGGATTIGDDGGPEALRPAHTVTLGRYFLDREVVSTAALAACVAARSCSAIAPGAGAARGLRWEQAHAYCVWAGKRLPTEAEWEHAAVTGVFTAADGTREWVQDWGTDCFDGCGNACGPACLGEDPPGPCAGAPYCSHSSRRVRKYDRRGRWIERDQEGLPATTFRCASSLASLSTWPPRVLARPWPAPPEPASAALAEVAAFRDVVEDEDVLTLQPCTPGASRTKCRDPDSYVVTNELERHLWAPYLQNLGGGFVGVGADQAYTYIAAARSHWAWLLDYDPLVVRLHAVLHALIGEHQSRRAFVDAFDPRRVDETRVLLERVAPSAQPPLSGTVVQIGAMLHRHYATSLSGHPSAPTFGWLATDEGYAHIRRLVTQGRILSIKGNLLREGALPSIGRSARKLGVTVRIFYPSNADSLWALTDAYRRNVLALPFDEHSVVLRTVARVAGTVNDPDWRYLVHGGLHQQRYLRRPGWDHVAWFTQEGLQTPSPRLTVIGLPGAER